MESTPDQFAALEAKIDALTVSVNKVRTYFKWTLIATAAIIVIPLLAIPFVIPSFLNAYQGPAIQSLLNSQ